MQMRQQIVKQGLSQTCRLVCGGAMSMPVGYASLFHTAHDYYPFGQYIPGRYTDDTATHCLTTTYSGMAMVQLYDSIGVSRSSTFGSATCYHMTTPMIYPPGSPSVSWGPGYIIASHTLGSGAEIIVGPVSVYGDKVMLKFNSVVSTYDFTVYDDMTGTPLTATISTTGFPVATTVTLNVLPATIPHSSYLRIKMECTASSSSIPGSGLTATFGTMIGMVELISVTVPLDTVVPSNIVSTVCNNDGYRYGFNGKQKDNEWAGVGNHYDYGFRRYDPRIARFISIDPLTKKYPWYTPFQFAGNSPIMNIDLDGAEPLPYSVANFGSTHGEGEVRRMSCADVYYHCGTSATYAGWYRQKEYNIVSGRPVSVASRGVRQLGAGIYNLGHMNSIGWSLDQHADVDGNDINGSSIRHARAAGFPDAVQLGGKTNAFNHAIWQGVITNQYGWMSASVLADAHEVNPYFNIQHPYSSSLSFDSRDDADMWVDLQNNHLVRDAMSGYNGSETVQGVALYMLDYYKNNGLWVIESKDDKYKLVLYKINESEYNQAKQNIENHEDEYR